MVVVVVLVVVMEEEEEEEVVVVVVVVRDTREALFLAKTCPKARLDPSPCPPAHDWTLWTSELDHHLL